MMQRPSRPARRLAFSLIEILIVISIIGILMGMLLAGLSRARAVVEDVRNKNDIAELHKAIYAFATSPQLGAPGFPPSKLDLPGKLTGGPTGNINNPDVAYMMRCFPNCGTAWSNGQIDWGKGVNTRVQLEGENALVYFLAGPKGNGFSTNPANPGDGFATRIGPFYNFNANRLGLIGPDSMPAYTDPFGRFYAYFNTTTTGLPSSDCNSLLRAPAPLSPVDLAPVQPYAQLPSTTLYNADSFQIISAGRDNRFGSGDDYSNFWRGRASAGN